MLQSVAGAVLDETVADEGDVEHCGRCASDESVLGRESPFCHGVRSVLTPEFAIAGCPAMDTRLDAGNTSPY